MSIICEMNLLSLVNPWRDNNYQIQINATVLYKFTFMHLGLVLVQQQRGHCLIWSPPGRIGQYSNRRGHRAGLVKYPNLLKIHMTGLEFCVWIYTLLIFIIINKFNIICLKFVTYRNAWWGRSSLFTKN